jgi:hypothetical protein
VDLPTKVGEGLIELAMKLGFTDRRIVKAVKVVKAAAYLNARDSVGWDDLRSMKFMRSLDAKSEREATTIIDEFVNEFSVKQEQKEHLARIKGEWDHVSGDHKNKEHLREETHIMKQLVYIDPIDEDMGEKRDSLLHDIKKHYTYYRKELMASMGLSEDLEFMTEAEES